MMALNIQEHYEETALMIATGLKYLAIGGIIFAACVILIVPLSAEPIPFNETIAGDRLMGQNFTWTMNNVSMQADAVYHYTVYDYKDIGDRIDYWSTSWGAWLPMAAAPHMKYVAVWVRGWLEGTAYHGWGQDRIFVWVGNRSYPAEPVKLQDLPIRNIGSYGKEIAITEETDCGQTTTYLISSTGSKSPTTGSRYLPVVIRQIENLKGTIVRGQLKTEPYGWRDENEMIRMEPGISNAFDGYILYQVPDTTRPEEVRIAGWFGYWGTAVWHVANVTITQESAEMIRQMEAILLNMERESGVRLPDNIEDNRVMA